MPTLSFRRTAASIAITAAAWLCGQQAEAQGIPDSVSVLSMSVFAHTQSDRINLNGNGTDSSWHSLNVAHEDFVQNNLGDTIAWTRLHARTRAQVTRKSIAALSFASAGSASGGNFYYGLGSDANANASVTNFFRIDHPSLVGQNGTLVASVRVDGAVVLGGSVGGAPAYTDGRVWAYIWVTGLAPIHSCFIGSPLCQGQTVVYSATAASEGGPISGTYELRIPFRFGDVGQIDMNIWTTGRASAVAYASGISMTGESNLLSGVRWNGITEVLDANGNPVQNWTITSPADLATPAPEPGLAAMLAAGTIALAACRGRGRSRMPE